MFGLFPMKSIVRGSGFKIDRAIIQNIGNMSGLYREEHGPNTHSFMSSNNKKFKNVNDEQMCLTLNQSNYIFVLRGTRTIKLYCDITDRKHTITITPDNVFSDGKLYYGSPAIIWWGHTIYHKSISGNTGCSSMHITEYDNESIINENLYKKPAFAEDVNKLINLP